MKRTADRWIAALKKNRSSGMLALAAFAAIGTASVAPAAFADHESPPAAQASATTMTKAAHAKTDAPAKKSAKAPAKKALDHKFELQPNYYYCGPAATRVALSAHGKVFSEDKIADKLGTTTNGTNSARDITRVLNDELGKGRYHTVEIPGKKASAKQVQQLEDDVVNAVSKGDPVVANVAGTVTDRDGDIHSYEGGHYLTVIGYEDKGDVVKIADSADKVGSPYYTLDVDDLANWIASRGYAA